MEKKIAVPVDETGRLDGHFGHCSFFALFNVSGRKIISEEITTPPPHEPGVLPLWLAGQGVTDVIAGGVGQKAIQIFNQNGVNVFVGAPLIMAKELSEGYLKGELHFTENRCHH